ncbi:ferredoxin-type protein NapF [Tropicimonas sp. IMCC6043]|uniref:ferredoxin-type protein NapF n=1 Tax=Tropicimonas sp. IMCC6043 TaxID=2510645 RepID=UPI00101B7847|nr:ferredoxin-type protein NapF [Tropicimonas sp. IMCC6043]RYH11723.1 ferredoxin-type protein NapF [Tropicimonas sp. IMCC6043]
MPPIPSRRDFLRGEIRTPDILRPPGATVRGFERACTGCGDCIAACPEAIIQSDPRGGVLLDLASGACTFCGACGRACPTDALAEERQGDWPWVAQVSQECLSLNRISCRACEDSCEARAIRFHLQVGGVSRPIIDDSACTGCGACVGSCPAAAVSLVRVSHPKLEACQS